MYLPDDFISYTSDLMGAELYSVLAHGLASEPPVSVRLNPLKCNADEIAAASYDGYVPWCREGLYLANRPNFTADPLLHAGAYYVQEASSMFVAHVLRSLVSEPVLMLDLCAAPGGKSTAARSVLPEGSFLFTNEPLRQRANILSENIQKFGHPDVVVTNNYPRDYRKSGLMFDVILTDVPCSGEGMFRKDEGAIADWSRRKVDECAALQREILSDIWRCLKPGGLLIYSTCTFNAAEDEDNAVWITEELGGDFVDVPTRPEWGITPAIVGSNPAYRFLPGLTRGEGLFMTVIRKHGDSNAKSKKPKSSARQLKQRPPKIDVPLLCPDDFTLLQQADTLFAVCRQWADIVQAAIGCLRVMNAGVTIGTLRGKTLVPDQSLALSAQLARTKFPSVEVEGAEALRYLHREAIQLPADTPMGYVLVTYHDLPLGFVKNLGNRSNNMFPTEWRIKSSHIDEPFDLLVRK